jgi:hypothetical protein
MKKMIKKVNNLAAQAVCLLENDFEKLLNPTSEIAVIFKIEISNTLNKLTNLVKRLKKSKKTNKKINLSVFKQEILDNFIKKQIEVHKRQKLINHGK